MVDESKEKCWIGLQEERGAPIRVCTCHSYGGIDYIGQYLYEKFSSWQYEKDGGVVVKKLRPIIDMKDITVGKISKVLKNVEALIRISTGQVNDEIVKQFDGFGAFYTAFFKAVGIDYAYLFAVDPTYPTNQGPVRYDWAAMTKISFSLNQVFNGTSLHFRRLEF